MKTKNAVLAKVAVVGLSLLALTSVSFGAVESNALSDGSFAIKSYNTTSPEIQSVAGAINSLNTNPGTGNETPPVSCEAAEYNIIPPLNAFGGYRFLAPTKLGNDATTYNLFKEAQDKGGIITLGEPQVRAYVSFTNREGEFSYRVPHDVTNYEEVKSKIAKPKLVTNEEVREINPYVGEELLKLDLLIDTGDFELDSLIGHGGYGGALNKNPELIGEFATDDSGLTIDMLEVSYPVTINYNDSGTCDSFLAKTTAISASL